MLEESTIEDIVIQSYIDIYASWVAQNKPQKQIDIIQSRMLELIKRKQSK